MKKMKHSLPALSQSKTGYRKRKLLSRKARPFKSWALPASSDLFTKDIFDILEIVDLGIEDSKQLRIIIRKRLTEITEDDIKHLNSLLDKDLHQRWTWERALLRLYEVCPNVFQQIRRSLIASLKLCFDIRRECQFSESLLQIAKLSGKTIENTAVGKINGLLIDLKVAMEKQEKAELTKKETIIECLQERKISTSLIKTENKQVIIPRQTVKKIVMRLHGQNIDLHLAILREKLEKLDFDHIGDSIELDIVIQETEQLARDIAEYAGLLARKIRY